MTSAENSVSEPQNFKNCLLDDTSRPPYKARAFGIRKNAPRHKKPS